MNENISILLTDSTLHIEDCVRSVTVDGAGGVVTFQGNVRDSTQGRKVLRLEFEAYAPMAVKEMQDIAASALARFSVKKIAIHHRVGILHVGETAVVVAVSSAHRAAAFEACAHCMDELKQRVPIWKKEVFEDGAVWVSAHP